MCWPCLGMSALLAIFCGTSFHEAAARSGRRFPRLTGDWRQVGNPSRTEPPSVALSEEILEFEHSKKPELCLALDDHLGEWSICLVSNPYRMIWPNAEFTVWSDEQTWFEVNRSNVYRFLRQIFRNMMPKRKAEGECRGPAVVLPWFMNVVEILTCCGGGPAPTTAPASWSFI